MKKETIEYVYRGQIERGSPNSGYRWVDGYSTTGANGGVTYPWMSYRECQKEAKSMGCKATFFRPDGV